MRTLQRVVKSPLAPTAETTSVGTADFNNDNKVDIIVTNSGTSMIGIFLSKGDGTFANQQTYSTGSGSYPQVVVMDYFNNDSYLDIAVANYGTNSIGVFLGIGNGTFSVQTSFSLGTSHPLFITDGDFNNDGHMDLVVVNYGTNCIGILLGYGDGSFQDQTTYPTGYDSIPYSAAVGDLNQDNKLDIAVTNYGTNNVGIFLGHGDGTFASQQIYTTFPKSNPTFIAIGYFNNDKHLDIVVSNNGTGNIGIFLGYGNATFLTQITYSFDTAIYPKQLAVGDFNGDNTLDIAIVDPVNDRVYIILGAGDGTFPQLTTYDDPLSNAYPYWIATADFDNDNKSDVVVVEHGTNEIRPLIGYSMVPNARIVSYPYGTMGITAAVVVADFNNDHILDIASNSYTDIMVLIGLGDGTFGSAATFPTGSNSNIQYMAATDLNNDNRMDIVITDLGYNTLGVLLGNSDGTFATITSYTTGTGSLPYWVTLSDINGDNHTDMICANQGTGTIGIFMGNGNGTFATMITVALYTGYGPEAVAVGDINNDGQLDLAVACSAAYIFILLGSNNGGTFTLVSYYFTGVNFGTFSIALAYFNNDTHLDIVAANPHAHNVSVLLGNGDGSFATQTLYSTGSTSMPLYAIVSDFNNDNISDIVVSDYGRSAVVILYGDGTGNFPLSQTYSSGTATQPFGIAVADLDNTKQLEIIVGLIGTGAIAVLTPYYAAEFIINTTYATGSVPQPYSVAVGDFNNDKRPDIVVANSGNGSLGILFNLGNDMFTAELTYLIGLNSYPQYVITNDINKDNQLDIISANTQADSISIIMGYGNGTFGEQTVVSLGSGSHPYAVVSADLNNDTWLDFVTANDGTNNIDIFFHFNYTIFVTGNTYYTTYSAGPIGIATDDFNHDGNLDVVTSFYWTAQIGIIFGSGDGTFTPMITYSLDPNSLPWDIAVGDFDKDGLKDIVVAQSSANNICILLGFTNATVLNVIKYSTGNSSTPVSVTINDLNADGNLDIVVANQGSGSIGVLLGYGNGTFSDPTMYSTGTGSSPSSVTVGDFNNDGRLDIAVANRDANNIGILLGYGNGTFGNQVIFPTGSVALPSATVWVAVGDFNDDNRLDIATANSYSSNVGILFGNGNGTFATMIIYSTGVGTIPKCIKIGDFNNDNISDIAVINSGTSTFFILFGFGGGNFLFGLTQQTGVLGYQVAPYEVAIGDFNKDGRLDLAITNNVGSYVSIFLALDSQPYGGAAPYPTGDGSTQPRSIAIGDLNNDGWLDIIVANYGTSNVGVVLGSGYGIFLVPTTYSTGINTAPYFVAAADINNDHQLDIVVSNSNTNNIVILFGNGTGMLSMGQTYTTGDHSHPYTLIIGDLNNDKNLDITVANSGISNIYLLYGNGNGTFGNSTSYDLGYNHLPYSIAMTDLNQDNWMDIVVANYGTIGIETIMQLC